MPTNIIACFRYKDAPAAIDWLCKAFGFERRLVVPDDNGGIAHAELKFHQGMIMLGSARDDAFGRLVKPPNSDTATVTGSTYIVVSDVDSHYRRAQAAGATIVTPPRDEDYGGRDYTCRDPQGYVWTFGDYDPFGASNV